MPAFIASNSQFLYAVEGGGREVVANQNEWLWWGTFLFQYGDSLGAEFPPMPLESGSRMIIHLQNSPYYLVPENGGQRRLMANLHRDDIPGDTAPSEAVFTIERVDGGGPIYSCTDVALRAGNGYYVCAEGGGGGEVTVSRTAIGPWETFQYRSIAMQADFEATLEPRPAFDEWVEYTVRVLDNYTYTPVPAKVKVANPGLEGDSGIFDANTPFSWTFAIWQNPNAPSNIRYPSITVEIPCYRTVSWRVMP